MIIYNVTTKVDWSIHDDWLIWMKEWYIPGIMETGFFAEYRMVKILAIDDAEGATYAVQYATGSIEDYNLFIETQSSAQYQKEIGKWGNKFVSFSTIMEVVH